MINFFIKFSVYFLISFLIMSMPLKGRSLFYHIDDITHPLTSSLTYSIGNYTMKTLDKGQFWLSKFFSNVKPDEDQNYKNDKIVEELIKDSPL